MWVFSQCIENSNGCKIFYPESQTFKRKTNHLNGQYEQWAPFSANLSKWKRKKYPKNIDISEPSSSSFMHFCFLRNEIIKRTNFHIELCIVFNNRVMYTVAKLKFIGRCEWIEFHILLKKIGHIFYVKIIANDNNKLMMWFQGEALSKSGKKANNLRLLMF